MADFSGQQPLTPYLQFLNPRNWGMPQLPSPFAGAGAPAGVPGAPPQPLPPPQPVLPGKAPLPAGFGGIIPNGPSPFSMFSTPTLEQAVTYENDPVRAQQMLGELRIRKQKQESLDALWTQGNESLTHNPKNPDLYGPATQPTLPGPAPVGNFAQGPLGFGGSGGAGQSDPMQSLLQGLTGGGAGQVAKGYTGGSGPGPLNLAPMPDLGAWPDAPVTPQIDYSTSDKYMQAAKPEAYAGDPKELGLSVLMGALQGFDPHGSVGEILGRLVGPGMQQGLEERRYQTNEERAREQDILRWNAAMGGHEQEKETTSAQIAKDNALAQYNSVLAKRGDALEQSKYGDDRAYKAWSADMQNAELDVRKATFGLAERAQVATEGHYANQDTAALIRAQNAGSGAGDRYTALSASIANAVNGKGVLDLGPGVSVADIYAAVQQDEVAKDPELKTQLLLNNAGAQKQIERRTQEKILQFLMTPGNEELLQNTLRLTSRSQGNTGSLEDFLYSALGQ